MPVLGPHGEPLLNDPALIRRMSSARSQQAALVVVPGLMLLWIVMGIDALGEPGLRGLGLRPGEWTGLIGVLMAPLLHGSLEHLLANTLSLAVLGMFIGYAYPRAALRTLALVWLLGGLAVWLVGRPVTHIGASGLAYGLAGYLLLAGLLRRDRQALALSLAVLLLYSGMLFGLLPDKPGVSWESHLAGGLSGLLAALLWHRLDRPMPRLPYSWELEAESEPVASEFALPRPEVRPLWDGPNRPSGAPGPVSVLPPRRPGDGSSGPPPTVH